MLKALERYEQKPATVCQILAISFLIVGIFVNLANCTDLAIALLITSFGCLVFSFFAK
ncbi:MAG: hypothetical protein RLZZ230_388 [Candidatus Parcubacteria bacterium]|jgi:hypothetical protein